MKPHSVAQILAIIAVAAATIRSVEADPPPAAHPVVPPDLALIPPDVSLLVAINLNRYWDSPETESLKQLSNAHPVIPTWAFKDMPAKTGLQPENIVRMTMFASAGKGAYSLATKNPYDYRQVLAALAPEAVQKVAGDKQYFYSAKSDNSVYFADDHTIVMGMSRDISDVLAQQPARERNPSLDRALAASLQGSPFVVHVGPTMIRAFAAEKQLPLGPFAPFAQSTAWQIIASIGNRQVTIELRTDYNTRPEADAALPALALVREELMTLVPFYQSHMIPFLKEQTTQYPDAATIAPEMDRAMQGVAEGLKTMRPEIDNNSAIARIAVLTDKPATTALMLITLMPRGEKGKGE